MKADQKKVLEWLAGDDTGISSKSLAFEFLGIDYPDRCHPLDPSDLGRCLRLIALVPAVEKRVLTLRDKHKGWKKAAKVWKKISDSMREEVGIDWSKGRSAPKTYDMMKKAGL